MKLSKFPHIRKYNEHETLMFHVPVWLTCSSPPPTHTHPFDQYQIKGSQTQFTTGAWLSNDEVQRLSFRGVKKWLKSETVPHKEGRLDTLPADVPSSMPGIPSGCSGLPCGSGPSVCPDTLPGLTANPPGVQTAWKIPDVLPNEAAEGDAIVSPNKNCRRQTDLLKPKARQGTPGDNKQLISFPETDTQTRDTF